MLPLIKSTFGITAQPLTLTLFPSDSPPRSALAKRGGEGIGSRNVLYLTPSSVIRCHALHLTSLQSRLQTLARFHLTRVAQDISRRLIHGDRIPARQHLLGPEQTQSSLQLLKFVSPLPQFSLRVLAQPPL